MEGFARKTLAETSATLEETERRAWRTGGVKTALLQHGALGRSKNVRIAEI
jgi:hypothetical protein